MQRSKPCEGDQSIIEYFNRQKATEVNISLLEEVIRSFNSYEVTEVVIISLAEEALQPYRGYAITEANMDLQ
jgi:hypothetical protein